MMVKIEHNWDSGNSWSMREFILDSGKPLDPSDISLLRDVEYDRLLSVYDLHRLNVLCYICIGYLEAKNEQTNS